MVLKLYSQGQSRTNKFKPTFDYCTKANADKITTMAIMGHMSGRLENTYLH